MYWAHTAHCTHAKGSYSGSPCDLPKWAAEVMLPAAQHTPNMLSPHSLLHFQRMN